jgi:hypothetical protein
MPDWKLEIRARRAGLNLEAAKEAARANRGGSDARRAWNGAF